LPNMCSVSSQYNTWIKRIWQLDQVQNSARVWYLLSCDTVCVQTVTNGSPNPCVGLPCMWWLYCCEVSVWVQQKPSSPSWPPRVSEAWTNSLPTVRELPTWYFNTNMPLLTGGLLAVHTIKTQLLVVVGN